MGHRRGNVVAIQGACLCAEKEQIAERRWGLSMSSGIKGQRSDTGADKKCYALSGIRIREAIGVFLAFDLLTVAVKSGRIINFLEYNGPAHHTFDIRLLTAKAYFDPDVSTKHFSRILCDR